MRSTLRKILLFFAIVIIASEYFFAPSLYAAADNEDIQTLQMYFDDKDIVESATRAPIEVSRVAENLTIVTAREIQAINAHTLADVLRNIPGMQIDSNGGPGSYTDFLINGANIKQVLVMIDGVQLNSLSDNVANIGSIPVQFIKRVEIIKGPGSSSWGPAMGGVINIVTKDPDEESKIGGTLSSSLGERGTGDYRGELSGSFGSFGYYFAGGKLASSGLTPNTDVDENNIYSKFKWNLPANGSILFTLGYVHDAYGVGQSSTVDFSGRIKTKDFFSTLALQYPLSERLDLELSGRVRNIKFFAFQSLLSTGEETYRARSEETVYGTSTKLTFRQHRNTAVIGVDFDHGRSDSDDTIDSKLVRNSDKWGIFVNDTLSIGPVSLSPGFRYDWTNYNGDYISASIGLTYNLLENTLLRAYVGKGYSIPSIVFNTAKEKVITYQAGFESSDIRYLLLKATYFRSYSTDATSVTTGESEDQVKQGIEAEVRTVPFLNTSLFAGFNFVDARTKATDALIPGIARYTWNLGIYYDDRRSLQGNLTGHYIWWNNINDSNSILPGRYSSFLWDLNLSKRIISHKNTSADIFFTAHNIFNGSQYKDGLWPNPRRWFEGGVRFSF